MQRVRMKRIALLVAVSLALAAVPAAFAADGASRGSGARIQRLQQRLDRFFDRCGNSSAGAPQRCIDVAHRAVTRLQTVDAKVQQALGQHPKLHALDQLLQTDIGRLQAWLGSSA
jgi:hypothetical protein